MFLNTTMTLIKKFRHNPQACGIEMILPTRAGTCNAFESDSSETKQFGQMSSSVTTENPNGVHIVSPVSRNATGHHIRKETIPSEACNSH
mmetsp:Transcript_24481/g.48964  ORF Transcript_24481/g.48964 Transcript_24481/m.48964 type:complete len:90 (-) Transcript_24481:503-772(-)